MLGALSRPGVCAPVSENTSLCVVLASPVSLLHTQGQRALGAGQAHWRRDHKMGSAGTPVHQL